MAERAEAAAGFAAEVDYPSTRSATYGLTLLFLAYVLSFVDRQVLALLVGPIRDDFGITDFEFSLLQGAAFALLYTFAGLPLGRLADRYSRRTIVAVSVFAWSALTCACGLTKSFTQLFIARMGVGAGEAGLAPPAYSIIVDSFRPQHMGYAMAVYKVGVTVGGGVAFVIGGTLFDYFTSLGTISLPIIGDLKPWQATFVALGAPGFVLAILFTTMLEPTRKGVVASAGSAGLESLPLSTVLRFLWQRKRVYLALFTGSSMLAMAGYGSAAWYPEFLFRNYGLSKSEGGAMFGSIYLVAGTLGVLAGPWFVEQLRRRGYADACVRTILIATALATVPAVVAPLAGSPAATFILLVPAIFLGATYLGVMAASFPPITPNQMRGQTTALYIFVTNILGMAVGTSVLAAFTDFVFQDDNALHYSLASVHALFYPLAMLLFWYCLPAYRTSVEEAGNWEL